MVYKIKKFKPRTLGYKDSSGVYHGPWMVTGSRRFKPIHGVSKLKAEIIAKARNKVAIKMKGGRRKWENKK